jgi:hypothetical protein
MSSSPIWRYLSLAKYIDLLRTQSLYFPKASLFQDETEGKWWGHAYLHQNAEKWRHAPTNIKSLEEMLRTAGQDQSSILREINLLIPSANEWVRNILTTAKQAYPHKRREYIEGVVSTWKRLYDDHNKSVGQWKADIAIERECTYISCWNRATSMSLAMWEMYGGGREAVAVRSTRGKLDALIEHNTSFLEKQTLEGAVADVEYIEGLKGPNDQVQERIYQTMFERNRDYRIGLFAIKPSVYEFEQEVRAVIYPKRDLLDPIENPHPDISGLHLPICGSEPYERTISHFIEKVYLHPMLGEDSMMIQTVKGINARFGLPELPVVADKIEAMGADIALPLAAKPD